MSYQDILFLPYEIYQDYLKLSDPTKDYEELYKDSMLLCILNEKPQEVKDSKELKKRRRRLLNEIVT